MPKEHGDEKRPISGSPAHRKGRRSFGVIGGLGVFGGADVLLKLVKALSEVDDGAQSDVFFEQHPFDDDRAVADAEFSAIARKFYVFDTIKSLESRGIDYAILPCFISHTFVDEVQPEIGPTIINIMEAIRAHLSDVYGEASKIGILTSTFVREKRLFEHYLEDTEHSFIYPTPEVQEGKLMEAVYGPSGIKAGNFKGRSIELIGAACRDLIDQGAEVIVPGMTEIPIILDSLTENLPVPVIDSNLVHAIYAAEFGLSKKPGPFKIGIVGGVGPAATVDFMDKVIKWTDAGHDREHIKMVVEHNPQIPDRTENLIGEGADPTVSLYAACKKLESQSANLIAIPCNTAHAFVERIQRHLGIPIVNMIFETVQFVKAHCSGRGDIGLLATTGTVKCRVYHDILDAAGFKIITPDDAHQAKVMEAIYGDNGVKAGFTEGPCRENLMAALAHLVDRGAGVVILGCTELPLLLSHNEAFPVQDRIIAVLDPTDVLARKVVQYAQGSTES